MHLHWAEHWLYNLNIGEELVHSARTGCMSYTQAIRGGNRCSKYISHKINIDGDGIMEARLIQWTLKRDEQNSVNENAEGLTKWFQSCV